MSDLPRELAELYAAERAASPTAAARTAVRAKLAATVGHAPLGAAAAGGSVVKIIAIIALTIGAGTATVAALRHDTVGAAQSSASIERPLPTQVEPHEQTASVPTVASAPAPALIAAAPRPVPPRVRPHRSGTTTVAQAVTSQPTDMPSQTELVRNAWLALSSNEPERALALVDEDLRLHPTGPLAEERDAVQVLALASANRIDDARAAEHAFLEKYPNSVHRDRVVHAFPEEGK